jgi:hypothetical protein
MIKQIAVIFIFVPLFVLGLTACSNDSGPLVAAPLGDRAVLEALSNSYSDISNQQLSVSPMSLRGDERKKFLTKVFKASGYSYADTLSEMARHVEKNNQLHIDMAELVLMPHRHPKKKIDLAEIYTAQELTDVAVIERRLNM